jgi:amino acid permease
VKPPGLTSYSGGPASLLIAYILLGLNVWATITALGEMGAQYPMKKGFAGNATRFVDPALGYASFTRIILNAQFIQHLD